MNTPPADSAKLDAILRGLDAIARRLERVEKSHVAALTKADVKQVLASIPMAPQVRARVVRQAEENGVLKGILLGVGGMKAFEHRDEIMESLERLIEGPDDESGTVAEDPATLAPPTWGYYP